TRIMTAASGSRRRISSALKSPDVIQVNTSSTIERDSGGIATSIHTTTDDKAKDAIIAAQAIAPETTLVRRRPNVAFSRNPTNGIIGISTNISVKSPRK